MHATGKNASSPPLTVPTVRRASAVDPADAVADLLASFSAGDGSPFDSLTDCLLAAPSRPAPLRPSPRVQRHVKPPPPLLMLMEDAEAVEQLQPHQENDANSTELRTSLNQRGE